VALVSLNFWHGQPHLQMGFGAYSSALACLEIIADFAVAVFFSFQCLVFVCLMAVSVGYGILSWLLCFSLMANPALNVSLTSLLLPHWVV